MAESCDPFFSPELQHRLGVDQVDAMISKRRHFLECLKPFCHHTYLGPVRPVV